MKNVQKISAVKTIIVICAVIHLLILFWPAELSQTERAIFFGAYYKAFIAAGEWWRLLTVGFVHASSIHLLVNMSSLFILGRAMEPTLKTGRFLILLYGSVIGGSVFYFCTGNNTVAVGLSGGLYGVLAAYIYLVWQSGAIRIPQVRNGVLQTLGINLMINFMPGVAWRAHFGGAVTGLLLIMVLVKRSSDSELKRNGILALVILCIISFFAVRRSANLKNDDIYLMTDMNILNFESEMGMTSYAAHMAENLDRVYDISYLEPMFR